MTKNHLIFRKFNLTSTDQYCDLTAYVPAICQHFFLVLNLRRKTRREISVAACGRRPCPLKTQSICAGIIQCNTERRKRQLHTNEREIRITMRGKALKEKNQCSNILVLVKITQGPTRFSMGILEGVKWQLGSDCRWFLRQKLKKNINCT